MGFVSNPACQQPYIPRLVIQMRLQSTRKLVAHLYPVAMYGSPRQLQQYVLK